MATLTAKERKWVEELQAVLDACPSKRLGFFTVGDPQISIYDRRKEKKLDDPKYTDFCMAVADNDAHLADLRFPAPVCSTAG